MLYLILLMLSILFILNNAVEDNLLKHDTPSKINECDIDREDGWCENGSITSTNGECICSTHLNDGESDDIFIERNIKHQKNSFSVINDHFRLLNLTDTLGGFPVWHSYVCIAHQYGLFPFMFWFSSVKTFNIMFSLYFFKDIFYDIDIVLAVHHMVALFFVWVFSVSKRETGLFTIAELGSGGFNVYTLAKYYGIYVYHSHVFFAIVMTTSNIYCIQYVVRRRDLAIPYRVLACALFLGRQYFIPML
jgi:hypothetical protein